MSDQTINTQSSLPILMPRRADSHKGDYGRALLVGGSRGMSGAISLAGMGCLRSGAGLVTLAVPEVCLDTVAQFEPSYMTTPLSCDGGGRLNVAAQERLAELADAATCVACGPGLGRTRQLADLVVWMYEVLPQPIVFDADALYALAQRSDRLNEAAGPRILTPHLGELKRMLAVSEINQQEAELRAAQWAAHHHAVVVLKGHATVVTDGLRSTHNATGNPGMATGGTGDVLTGVITALICQGMNPFDAARLGVMIHGSAGDKAADELGQVSLIASDIVRFLPAAFKEMEG
ncbi:MAG: NAD(P)H-hydrate dehydratase [Planctomycetaceae bacterium]|nr:NAD(P)H-hydrate dehydratase [Planctomycetaceae bacterium]